MSEEELLFFDQHPGALPLYEAFVKRVLAEVDGVEIRVKKTQISFANRRNFACVSFLPVRRAQDRPKDYLVITFSLESPVSSPRIDVVTEPYPQRWTHHVLIAKPEEIDGELLEWVRQAASFSARKR